MFEIGRVCLKIAGRDANNYCVIIKKIDSSFVMVDGQTRRKKVNVKHLEPTNLTLEIKEDADHGAIVEAFSKIEIKIASKKSKKPTQRLKKIKKQKEKKEVKPKKDKKSSLKENLDSKLEEKPQKEEKKINKEKNE